MRTVAPDQVVISTAGQAAVKTVEFESVLLTVQQTLDGGPLLGGPGIHPDAAPVVPVPLTIPDPRLTLKVELMRADVGVARQDRGQTWNARFRAPEGTCNPFFYCKKF